MKENSGAEGGDSGEGRERREQERCFFLYLIFILSKGALILKDLAPIFGIPPNIKIEIPPEF